MKQSKALTVIVLMLAASVPLMWVAPAGGQSDLETYTVTMHRFWTWSK